MTKREKVKQVSQELGISQRKILKLIKKNKGDYFSNKISLIRDLKAASGCGLKEAHNAATLLRERK